MKKPHLHLKKLKGDFEYLRMLFYCYTLTKTHFPLRELLVTALSHLSSPSVSTSKSKLPKEGKDHPNINYLKYIWNKLVSMFNFDLAKPKVVLR